MLLRNWQFFLGWQDNGVIFFLLLLVLQDSLPARDMWLFRLSIYFSSPMKCGSQWQGPKTQSNLSCMKGGRPMPRTSMQSSMETRRPPEGRGPASMMPGDGAPGREPSAQTGSQAKYQPSCFGGLGNGRSQHVGFHWNGVELASQSDTKVLVSWIGLT